MVGIFFSVRFLHICTAVIYWRTLSLCASRSTSASPSRLSLHSYSAFMIRGNPKLGVLGLTTVRINYVHWLRWHRLHHPWALRGVHCNYASRGVLFYLSLVTATSVLCAPRSTFPAGHLYLHRLQSQEHHDILSLAMVTSCLSASRSPSPPP